MEKRILNSETVDKVGATVTVAGWVHARRDHGKIVFLDLRDRSGLLQVVIANADLVTKVTSDMQVGREFVLTVTGVVNARPEKLINPGIVTGKVELLAESVELISTAKTPPFEIEDGTLADEEIRMQYRYLDLRRPEMLQRFILRHKVIHFMRNWLTVRGFIEVETPMLTKDTPEGAKEYIVPSRLHQGKGYALPQSPQQFKQLLMVAGFEKYFQIAKCMRDEDPRGDRQQEFTQLDLEMSFTDQEQVLQLIEKLYTELVDTLFPEKKILFKPFKRLTYAESMEKYNSDKPDLREDKSNPDELAFAFVTDFPMFEMTKEGNVTTVHHPFTSWHKEFDSVMDRVKNGEQVDKKELLGITSVAYDLVLNGYELGSGSIRIHQPQKQEAVFKALNLTSEQIQARFGHMLTAFSYGVPPHGGMAPGIDRFVMLLTHQPNIREVIAFPKTGDGRDLMMGAPAEISDEKLKELHLKKLDL